MNVTPAYGRFYATRKDAIAAWKSGVDFIFHDPSSRWDGKACSIRDFPDASMQIRYGLKLKNVCTYTPGEDQ